MPTAELETKLAVTLADIEAARERVRDAVYYSPCAHSRTLSGLTGQEIYLKLENLQMTGAFKERGALNRISLLTPSQAAHGVIAAFRRQPCAGCGVSRDAPRHPRDHCHARADADGQGDGNARFWRGT